MKTAAVILDLLLAAACSLFPVRVLALKAPSRHRQPAMQAKVPASCPGGSVRAVPKNPKSPGCIAPTAAPAPRRRPRSTPRPSNSRPLPARARRAPPVERFLPALLGDWQHEQASLWKREKLRPYGYTTVSYSEASPSLNTLTLSQLKLELMGHEWKRLLWKIEFQPDHHAQWVNAYLQWRLAANYWVTGGQFKIPFSHEMRTGSTSLETIDRPVSVNALSPGREFDGNGHEFGADIAGNLLRNRHHLWLRLTVGAFNGYTIDTAGGARPRNLVLRLKSEPIPPLTLAWDYVRVSSPGNASGATLTDDELYFYWHRWKLQGEWLQGRFTAFTSSGEYGQVAYRFMRHWSLVVLADHYRPDSRSTAGEETSFLAGMTWYLTPTVRWQFNQVVRRTLPDTAYSPSFQSQVQWRF